MRKYQTEHHVLAAWAFVAGIALWTPAIGIPLRRVYLQPLDILILAGLPLIAIFWRQFTRSAFFVLVPMMCSIALSWIAMGGSPMIMAWTVIFALPFTAISYLALRSGAGRRCLTQGFLLGAALSTVLFLCQIVIGAEVLDFRTNTAFSLPPQYGRGFALFPEVSTFAAHAAIAFGVALVVVLHPVSDASMRRRALILMVALATAFLFSRSTSVIVLVPLLTGFALSVSTRPSLNTLLLAMVIAALGALFLSVFLSAFYVDRIASAAAERSASMRMASVLGGLSPLFSGEIFGLGLGENEAVRLRAHQVARELGLSFGNLPSGVNSQIVGRIFEEGWPALIGIGLASFLLISSRRIARSDVATSTVFVLGMGSLLTALLVTGYRGIFTNWLWLAAAAALSSLGQGCTKQEGREVCAAT